MAKWDDGFCHIVSHVTCAELRCMQTGDKKRGETKFSSKRKADAQSGAPIKAPAKKAPMAKGKPPMKKTAAKKPAMPKKGGRGC